MSGRKAIPKAVEAEVLRMYASGDRVTDIQATTGLARASVYWVLEKNDVRPDRIQRTRRGAGLQDAEALTEQVRSASDLIRRHRLGELEARAALNALEALLRGVPVDNDGDDDLMIAIPRSVKPEYFAAALRALVEQNPLMLVTSVYDGVTLLDETELVVVDDPAVGKIPSLRGSVVDDDTYSLTGEERTIALRWIGRVAVPDPFKR